MEQIQVLIYDGFDELAELTARRMEYAWHDLPICAQRDKMNAASSELPSNT